LVRGLTAATAVAGVYAGLAEPVAGRQATTVVNVSTEAQLQTAMSSLASGRTIVLAPGTYRLSNTLWFNGAYSNIVIRGSSGNRDEVVLQGPGMTQSNYGSAAYGIWTGGGVQGITIQDLTIRDFYHHGIVFNAGTERPRVINVRMVDIGTQFIKANPDGSSGTNNGLVERSAFEYTTQAPGTYTNGVDVHTGQNWIIRSNLFRNITSSAGLAGPALLMWNSSTNTLAESNTFINCARGIAFGLIDKSGGFDHSGGIIRNNVVFRASGQGGDVGIGVADSPNTQVLNNTVFLSGTYATPIELRFTSTTGAVVTNNLIDGTVSRRNGAVGAEAKTLRASPSMFVNAAGGDLHLVAGASAVDAGDNLANVTTDFDGDSRPIGPATDIGADEYRPRHVNRASKDRPVLSGDRSDEPGTQPVRHAEREALPDGDGCLEFRILRALVWKAGSGQKPVLPAHGLGHCTPLLLEFVGPFVWGRPAEVEHRGPLLDGVADEVPVEQHVRRQRPVGLER
jgi:hypothetical protein